jgi:hypothetical protein
MRKDEESVIVIQGLALEFSKTDELKLRSAATSLFDVQRWAFNVRCSIFSEGLQICIQPVIVEVTKMLL